MYCRRRQDFVALDYSDSSTGAVSLGRQLPPLPSEGIIGLEGDLQLDRCLCRRSMRLVLGGWITATIVVGQGQGQGNYCHCCH